MTLRSRLTLGLVTIAFILIVPLLIAMQSLNRLHRETKALRDGDFVASLMLGRLREAINDLKTAELSVLFVRDEKSLETMNVHVDHVAAIGDSLEAYQLNRAARDIRLATTDIAAGIRSEHAAAVARLDREAESISKQRVQPAVRRAEAAVQTAERTLGERTRERVAETARAAKQARGIAIVGLVLAVIVAALIAVRLTQSVSGPVTELERGMRKVADGEFDAKLAISPSREDEFGRLAASFGEMTRQLAELDKLKAEVMSVASHELRTPINVVLGYVQLLRQGVYGPLSEKQEQVADVIEKQTDRLTRLVKQLLDVSRFEAGAGKLDVRPVELHGFLHQLENAFQVLADQRGIRFQISVHDGLAETVQWDADRMNEVLGNLLSNAFKFTERGGEVDLTVLPVDHSVHIEVRDTGAGIPPEQVPHIFEKFYQADNQAAAAHGGTGLGLAIVREIVEAHGGTISCESTPGVGTTFTIVLPQRVAGRRISNKHLRVTADVG